METEAKERKSMETEAKERKIMETEAKERMNEKGSKIVD
jgi:hypothetical protein